jgi:hypothetical protein
MPMTFRCPVDACGITASHRPDFVQHVNGTHALTLRGDEVTACRTFESQVVAQGGQRFSRPVGCPVCARLTTRTDTDATFRHDDGTLACVGPDSLMPYPTQGETR